MPFSVKRFDPSSGCVGRDPEEDAIFLPWPTWPQVRTGTQEPQRTTARKFLLSGISRSRSAITRYPRSSSINFFILASTLAGNQPREPHECVSKAIGFPARLGVTLDATRVRPRQAIQHASGILLFLMNNACAPLIGTAVSTAGQRRARLDTMDQLLAGAFLVFSSSASRWLRLSNKPSLSK